MHGEPLLNAVVAASAKLGLKPGCSDAWPGEVLGFGD